VIGNPPAQLRPAETIDRYLPHSREEATDLAFKGHPAVLAAGFDVDVASTTIHVAESSLLPPSPCKATPATAASLTRASPRSEQIRPRSSAR